MSLAHATSHAHACASGRHRAPSPSRASRSTRRTARAPATIVVAAARGEPPGHKDSTPKPPVVPSKTLAAALSSVQAVRNGSRDAFDALDRRCVAGALKALVASDEAGTDGGVGDGDTGGVSASSGGGGARSVDYVALKQRVRKACALIREIESVCLERGCENAVSAEALEAVARAGCSIRNDPAVTLAVVKAFYTIARKGKGATSAVHASVRTYTDVIAALSRCCAEARSTGALRSTPSPVEVWLMLRATPLKLDGAAYAAGVGAYVAEGRLEEAEKVLREMTADGVRAGPRLFNTLITGYGRAKNLRGVEASSMAMRTLGVAPNQATWGAKVYAYVACERLDLALDALEQGVRFSPRTERRPGVQAYTALVQGLARAGRVGEADEILRRMSRDGVKPNVYTYSTLIDGFMQSAQVGLAETALKEMKRAQIMPNVVTYNSILKGVVRRMRAGKRVPEDDLLTQARRVFDRMRDDGVAPDLVTYNTLIDACIDAQEPAEAWNVLREISQSGLKPDVVTYTTLLKYFVQVGDNSATQWVIAEMDTDPLMVQDVGVYNCLINAYARQGDMCRANEALRAMEEKKIAPNIATYGSLLEGYVRVGNAREAIKVYDLCTKSKDLSPDARMRKSLIYGCGLHGLSDVADCIIADLQATGEEGAREARTLRFVLKASMEAKADEIDGRVDRSRMRKNKNSAARAVRDSAARTASLERAVATPQDATLTAFDEPCPAEAVEFNRGLEMWKYWLGLPNNYYAATAAGTEATGSPTEPTLENS